MQRIWFLFIETFGFYQREVHNISKERLRCRILREIILALLMRSGCLRLQTSDEPELELVLFTDDGDGDQAGDNGEKTW